MRNTMRDLLSKDKANKDGDPSKKTKLMKTYTDRETELMENLGVEKAKTENLKEKLKKMRTYARKARNLTFFLKCII